MYPALLDPITLQAEGTAHRHAYNAAFEELGLPWHWDASTFARLMAHGRDGLRIYLESEHAHLLRAYEADFLIDAIESAKLRCYDQRAFSSAYAANAPHLAAPERIALAA